MYVEIAANRTINTNLLREVFSTYRLHDRLPTYAKRSMTSEVTKRSMTNDVTYLSACTLSVPFETITIRISPFRSQWR